MIFRMSSFYKNTVVPIHSIKNKYLSLFFDIEAMMFNNKMTITSLIYTRLVLINIILTKISGQIVKSINIYSKQFLEQKL